ncbi:hypothetical protein Taro_036440 [Colocasia esculenta]|uniref:INO80 complex subunit B-like conserved region domain-containing protein n=1 Tax=Colocasia esculenta TaxID=4460 RepID=A0A843W9S9_COLES|nr:hypothetical protein [Colocasia esculenta]
MEIITIHPHHHHHHHPKGGRPCAVCLPSASPLNPRGGSSPHFPPPTPHQKLLPRHTTPHPGKKVPSFLLAGFPVSPAQLGFRPFLVPREGGFLRPFLGFLPLLRRVVEEFGVSGFNSGTAVAKKRRSTTSRRPRPDSQLLLEGRDPSPPSSTPSSDNGSKQSTDGSSGHHASVRRKEVNLNSLVPKIASANRNEGATNTSRRLKKDDRTSGDYDGFYSSGVQRPSRSSVSNHGFSESKRSSEGVLAPSNWKSYVRHRERLSPESHIDSGKSGADAHDMGRSEPAPNGAAENKLRKVKLKVGGVTRTIHAKSDADGSVDGGTSAKPSRLSDASRHRQKLILKDKSDDDLMPLEKGDGFQGVPWKDFSDGSFSSASKESSIHGKSTDDFVSRKQIDKAQSATTFEPVRKSKRVPKRRVLDGAFDDDEDDELRYLERLKTTKLNSDPVAQHDNGGSDSNKKQKFSKLSKRASYEVDEDFSLSRRSKEGKKKSRSDREPEDVDYVEDEEAGSDVSESGSKKQRKEPLDSLSDSRREFTLTTRQRALQSGKDGSGGNNTSLIEFPNGLPPAPPRKQKGKLSEVEQQLKKAEAAQRRRLQVEKAARESEAEAIRKILGQDSNRKKREDKLQKKREEIAQEKAAKSIELAANAVRLVMGPSGTTVTFPESVGLPISLCISVILLPGRNVRDPPVPIPTNTEIRSLTYHCVVYNATRPFNRLCSSKEMDTK